MSNDLKAEVVAVYPNRIKIKVDKLEDFKIAEQSLKIGSYLEISDNDNAKLLAMIENFSIEVSDTGERNYFIEANPLGIIKDGKFSRGGDDLAIPPKDVKPALIEDVKKIYESSIEPSKKFSFSKLARCSDISVPVDGDRFFNKHIAIVGATGSGKSHTVTKIIQEAVSQKSGKYSGLNNSHIIIFDIHSEYKSAFPDANYISINELILPYWLLNSEELEELFIDTEANDHNQRNIFKEAVIDSKLRCITGSTSVKVHYDSPLLFNLEDILAHAKRKNEEMIPGKTGEKQGSLNGKLTNFISRLENKINDKRLDFLLGAKCKKITFEETIRQFIGYKESSNKNVTILDISGVPFEVLSISVSLISRMLFEFGYYLKKNLGSSDHSTPLLLIYEEAHKYAPKSGLAKYRASLNSIERIAKEGRKYGVTLLIASQRPSEISETIFSQCNNFIAMRLTNPDDQNYVKRLLPDALGNITETLPTLKSGEAILIGDSVLMPSLVLVERCSPEPSSNDIPYLKIWKDKWKDISFDDLIKKWQSA
ncbi:MAG: ATP-binding protein [Victivallales bacterium]